MRRVGVGAITLLLGATAIAATVRKVHIALGGDSIKECVEMTLEGFSDEEANTVIGKLTGPENKDSRKLETSCAAEEKRLGVKPLGGCTFRSDKDNKSMTVQSWSYDPEITFGEGGHKSQCKGTWKATADGTKAEVKVLAAQAEARRRAALPRATAVDIGAEYEGNEVAADERYKGKTFLVTGRVQSVKKDHKGRVFLQAAGGNMFLGVHLYVKDQKFTGSLKPDDEVELECTGQGQDILRAPMFACR
jgi:hypothetical protein